MSDVVRYLKQYVFPGTLKKNNIMLLEYAIPILNKNNIEYFLTDGTLLGCYRDKDIIEGDDDVDILIMEKDFKKSIELLNNDLPSFMTKMNPNVKATTSLNIKNGEKTYLGKIDFNTVYQEGKKIYKIEDNQKYDYDYDDIFPLKEEEFLGLKVKIPKNTEKILEIIYGKDFMIPRAHYKGPKYLGKQFIPPEIIQYSLPLIKKYILFLFLFLIPLLYIGYLNIKKRSREKY